MISIICFSIGTFVLLGTTLVFVSQKTEDDVDTAKLVMGGITKMMWYIASVVSHYIGLP